MVIVESDDWKQGPTILSPENLALLQRTLEETLVIVEHWFYRGSRAPNRLFFDDFGELEEYLRTHAAPGDSFWIWRYDELCRDDNSLVHAKYPDDRGRVPSRGAY